jgi:hypothetical protein
MKIPILVTFCLFFKCTVLYYTILYYTILYYTILYYTILYYTILYRVAAINPEFSKYFLKITQHS